jgi:hypothetical protein
VASEIDICNLALGTIGNAATVASFEEGSAEADYCRRFYPIVRDELMEKHDWNFATRRVALAQVTNPSSTWMYAYAAPSNMQRALAVLDPQASDDDAESWLPAGTGSYTPQAYRLESAADGSPIILANQVDAVLRYTVLVTDAGRYPASVVMVLVPALASKLAGPIIKGDKGAQTAMALRREAYGQDGRGGMFAQAVRLDASQKHSTTRDKHSVPWLVGR